jgi:hypothetical protein
MSTCRPRSIASLSLLAAALAVAACAVLLRPDPAGAAGSGKRQFVFPPLWIAPGQVIGFQGFNPGPRPSPPATANFLDVATAASLATPPLPSLGPGQGLGYGIVNTTPSSQLIAVIVIFNQPTAGQAVPNPFPGSVAIREGSSLKVQAVIGPAR